VKFYRIFADDEPEGEFYTNKAQAERDCAAFYLSGGIEAEVRTFSAERKRESVAALLNSVDRKVEEEP